MASSIQRAFQPAWGYPTWAWADRDGRRVEQCVQVTLTMTDEPPFGVERAVWQLLRRHVAGETLTALADEAGCSFGRLQTRFERVCRDLARLTLQQQRAARTPGQAAPEGTACAHCWQFLRVEDEADLFYCQHCLEYRTP